MTAPSRPLQIVVAFHPKSEAASSLAQAMFRRFSGTASRPGIRVPVGFSPAMDDDLPPPGIDFASAAHTLLVFLLDGRMAMRFGGGTGELWGDFVADQVLTTPPGVGSHAVLPVALDSGAFQVSKRLDDTSLVRLDRTEADQRESELFFQIAVRALQLLQGHSVAEAGEPENLKAPVKLFISHTKSDLAQNPAVFRLLDHLAKGPVEEWYDAGKIPPGGRFADEIHRGILESDALIAVLTDDYASREWCRREALEAKGLDKPIVLVDAVQSGESRHFPYLGNVPALRWREEPGMARRVVIAAVGETLRHRHRLVRLKTLAQDGDHVLGTAPELLTMSSTPPGTRSIFYPDPPLGSEEADILRRVFGDIHFETAWSRVVGRLDTGRTIRVGLSLSTATDASRYGTGPDHLGVVADDLCSLLLLAGVHLAYGGRLGHQEAGEEDYVSRLFGLVRSFYPQAAAVYRRELHPIVNYAGWPAHLAFGDEAYAQYGREADLIEVEPPKPLGIPLEELEPDDQGFFPPASDDPGQFAARRFAWGRGMTKMRDRMNAEIDARVSLGGNLERFVGQMPGVLEEGLLMLEAGKPLFLAGALGGATRLLIDGLEGRDRPEFHSDWARDTIPAYDTVAEIYARCHLPHPTMEDIGQGLRTLGADGPSKVLRNGLDDEQNRELFESTDPFRIVELVLTGLVDTATSS